MTHRNGVRESRSEAMRRAKMHAAAADHERRAASLGQMISAMQAEQISAMLEAAILRREARREPC